MDTRKVRDSILHHSMKIPEFRKRYAHAAKEISEFPALVIDSIRDRITETDASVQFMRYVRQVTVYCLVLIKDGDSGAAEYQAGDLARQITKELLQNTTCKLTQREPMRYLIGGRECMAARLSFEFDAQEAL